jgi:hypothetical protein
MTSGPFGVDYSDINKSVFGTARSVGGATKDLVGGVRQINQIIKPHKPGLKALAQSEGMGRGPAKFKNSVKMGSDPNKAADYRQKMSNVLGPQDSARLNSVMGTTATKMQNRFKYPGGNATSRLREI